jgi:CHAD domain-containing protein
LIARRWRAYQKRGRKLDQDATPDELHALRRQAKRVRYTSEFFTSLYRKPALRFAKAITKLQDVLGAQHDAFVAADTFRRLAREGRVEMSMATAFAMGALAERSEWQARSATRKAVRAFRRTQGKPWRRLQQAMSEA